MSRPETGDWLLCFLIDDGGGLVLPRPEYNLGQFSFSREQEPLPGCENALKESLEHYSLDRDGNYLRARTFFVNTAKNEIVRSGRLYLREALALFRHLRFNIGPELELLPAGYILDISTGNPEPVKRTPSEIIRRKMGMMGLLDEMADAHIAMVNTLLSTDPGVYGELGKAIRRFSHWSNHAAQADDYGEVLLMKWMSCETLMRVSETETLTPKFMAVSFFPTSRYFQCLPINEQAALSRVEDFKIWKALLNRMFDNLRDARNHIAHSGFREIEIDDFLSKEELQYSKRLLSKAMAALLRLSINGLILGVRSVEDLWKRFGECILFRRDRPIAEDTTSNIYILTQKDFEI